MGRIDRIEEADDPRTWTGELIPDCEREIPVENNVLEYLGEFKALIDACGQVSYYFNMKKFVDAGVNKAKNIASAYHHDKAYYHNRFQEWKDEAERSLGVLSLQAQKLGYEMPKDKNLFLDLATKKDRRKAYKGYLDTCLKKNKAISPEELEKKYQNLLRKRLEKSQKKK